MNYGPYPSTWTYSQVCAAERREEQRLASELFHADADRLVAEAEIAAQRNTLTLAAAKAKSRRFVVEQHSAFGSFA